MLLAAACGESGDKASTSSVEESSATATEDKSVEAFMAWNKAKMDGTVGGWEAFLDRYPDSGLAVEAKRRLRILELEPINMTVEVRAPEGEFMVQPLALDSERQPVPSGTVESMPAGTTLTLTFTAKENDEEVTEIIEATYDSAIQRAMVFRNDGGLCLTRANLTGAVSCCDGEEPPPPDPSDTRGMMVYAWLVAAYDL